MPTQPYPRRLTRAESFLGIHFDYHMNEKCTEIGKTVTPKMIERIIDAVRPDYIQCDCKGHRGLSSYPTRVGHPAPGFVRDQLRIWRRVTARRGVALYMHYSGVWDNEAVARHPAWARIDEKGKRDKQKASVFGPYVDELLIPQLKELADDYGVDGAWVDGECWATVHDYCAEAAAEFRRRTGLRRLPVKPEDPGYFEFSEVCREAFRVYLEHYVSALHRHELKHPLPSEPQPPAVIPSGAKRSRGTSLALRPGEERCRDKLGMTSTHEGVPRFQIASNWAYSSFMPERVTVPVDFISGDYSMQNSVNAARLEGRCMTRQGKPWDLMAWSFAGKWGEGCKSTKSVPQLQREAAIVLALGGGFQAYFRQKADGSIHDWEMKLMAETAKFCRARQAICHRAEAVPQVALVNSTAAFYRKSPRLFAPWGGELTPLSGILRSLLESQYSVEILSEHHLTGRMGDWPLIVVPEWEFLEPRFRRELAAYAKAGGSLLLIGPKTAAMFQKELRVQFLGEAETKPQWLEHGGWLCGMKTLSQRVKLGRGARAFGRLYADNEPTGLFEVAASIARLGKGKIAATYVNLGERYVNAATPTARKFLAALVRELFPKPIVEVAGSQYVDVQVNRIGGRLAVNLVNTAGPHADNAVYVHDEIPPLGPLTVTLRMGRRPKRVLLQPAGRRLRCDYARGEAKLSVPRLEIHDIVVVE